MTIETAIENLTQVKVFGIGGGGSNAVNRMIEQEIPGVDFIAANTDAQALVRSIAPMRLRIGDKLTKGLGVGGDHKLGMLAAEESRDELANAIQDTDMIFITAGMGGGTGTGAAPVVAEVAKELGVLAIGIVTRPFSFEGLHRAKVAEEGIIRLRERADTIIVIPNDRLLSICDKNISIEAAFKVVDEVVLQSVQGISELITFPGHINLDFADVRAIMSEAGPAWITIGQGSGETRAVDAARAALVSPLFDFSIERAKRILFNITGNELTLSEVNDAASVIKQVADPNSQIIFGLGADPETYRAAKLTLIATDFSDDESAAIANEDELPDLAAEAKPRSVLRWLK